MEVDRGTVELICEGFSKEEDNDFRKNECGEGYHRVRFRQKKNTEIAFD